MAPTTGDPTAAPTAKPSATPTLAPSIDPFFLNDNDDAADGQEATSPLATEAPKTASMVAIGVAAVAGIIVAAIVAALVAVFLLGGAGFFVTKKLLFEVESDVLSMGVHLEAGGTAVPVGQLAQGPPPTERPSGAPVGQLCAPPKGAIEMSDLPQQSSMTMNPVALMLR